jgi:hypothetical protein
VLEAAPGELVLRLDLSEDALVRCALAATVDGEAGRLWLDARLLRSLLDASVAARVELSWSAAAAPLVIRDVDGRSRWGVMPLRPPAEVRTAA